MWGRTSLEARFPQLRGRVFVEPPIDEWRTVVASLAAALPPPPPSYAAHTVVQQRVWRAPRWRPRPRRRCCRRRARRRRARRRRATAAAVRTGGFRCVRWSSSRLPAGWRQVVLFGCFVRKAPRSSSMRSRGAAAARPGASRTAAPASPRLLRQERAQPQGVGEGSRCSATRAQPARRDPLAADCAGERAPRRRVAACSRPVTTRTQRPHLQGRRARGRRIFRTIFFDECERFADGDGCREPRPMPSGKACTRPGKSRDRRS